MKYDYKAFEVIPNETGKLVFDVVGQPRPLNSPASLNLLKLGCFGAGCACLNDGRLLVKIPIFKSRSVYPFFASESNYYKED